MPAHPTRARARDAASRWNEHSAFVARPMSLLAASNRGASMSFRLRPVAEQTIVLTGASSGIGRARATLVLISRDLEELNPLAEECRARSGRALYPVLRLTTPCWPSMASHTRRTSTVVARWTRIGHVGFIPGARPCMRHEITPHSGGLFPEMLIRSKHPS